jgi:hypothetical protein
MYENQYSLADINRMTEALRLRWAGYVACRGVVNAYKVFVGKPEGNT